MIKSWARFYGNRPDKKVNIPEAVARYADEVVSRPDEIRPLFDHLL